MTALASLDLDYAALVVPANGGMSSMAQVC